MFGEMYAIERRIRELSLQGQEVVAVRQEESMPILQRMKQWMEQEYAALQVKKSAIAQAMMYFLSRWEKWCVYTRDGRLNIDNNPIENAIRPVALGRKNYLFSGSHEASERAAMIYSLLATCKLHDIDPYHWLKMYWKHSINLKPTISKAYCPKIGRNYTNHDLLGGILCKRLNDF